MLVKNSIKDIRDIVRVWKNEGLSIGFVPTMGYLHEGHCSLIKEARKNNDKVIVSIFINPIQFGPKEDLSKYPRDLERDCTLCNEFGADLVFNPTDSEMYCHDFSTFVDMTEVTEELCGKSRPTHFRGVCTVVSKLFNIVKCDRAYFGEKDAQQLAVIRRMVRDLSIDVEIIGCPIVREEDGLAKSSRNVYLSEEERKAALVLSRSLNKAKEVMVSGEKSAEGIKNIINEELLKEPLAKVDYVDIVDSVSMQRVEEVNNDVVVAIAVFIGKTRLIDNFSFKVEERI